MRYTNTRLVSLSCVCSIRRRGKFLPNSTMIKREKLEKFKSGINLLHFRDQGSRICFTVYSAPSSRKDAPPHLVLLTREEHMSPWPMAVVYLRSIVVESV